MIMIINTMIVIIISKTISILLRSKLIIDITIIPPNLMIGTLIILPVSGGRIDFK